MTAIVTCGCGDTEKFAIDAFKILFKDRPIPEVISQSPQNVDFAKWAPYIKAAEKAGDKYAYYLTDEEMWDLLKGVRNA